MKFNIPARIFSSMENIFIFYEITEDNRELIPEFFYNYDFLINLNCNDFSILDIQKENYLLNDVDIFYEHSYPEFIIKSINLLDEADLSPWNDLIFGPKQIVPSNDQPNLFALNSFEENSKLEKIKEEDIPSVEKGKKFYMMLNNLNLKFLLRNYSINYMIKWVKKIWEKMRMI